jgi:hypothetical protein
VGRAIDEARQQPALRRSSGAASAASLIRAPFRWHGRAVPGHLRQPFGVLTAASIPGFLPGVTPRNRLRAAGCLTRHLRFGKFLRSGASSFCCPANVGCDAGANAGADSLTPTTEGRPPIEGETHDTKPHRVPPAIGIGRCPLVNRRSRRARPGRRPLERAAPVQAALTRRP